MADQINVSTPSEPRAPMASLTVPSDAPPPPPPSLSPPRSTLSVATTSSSVRPKVALRPGRSLMDWIRLANSGEAMTSNKGQLRGITPAELAKHDTEADCWMSIHDQVYDVTRYMEYHPGGPDELMRGAGKDATELFNEAHRWVNFSSMLAKCLVGPLVIPRADVRRRRTIASPAHAKTVAAVMAPPRPLITKDRPKWDWTEEDASLTLVITYPDPVPHADYVSLSNLDGRLRMHTDVFNHVHNFVLNLQSGLRWNEEHLPTADGKVVRLVLSKTNPGARVPTVGQVMRDEWKLTKDSTLGFHKCLVVSRTEVTHDTLLFCLEWPEGFHIRVPMGHHIRCRVSIEESADTPGIELARSYTPVPSSLLEPRLTGEERSGRRIFLMFKVYPDGCLTPHLALHEPDSHLSVSSPEGSFHCNLPGFRQARRLLLLAAGTGFTPMARLIRAALHGDEGPAEPALAVRLLFFNKRRVDIPWRDQLEALEERFPERMSVVHVLSAEDEAWPGRRGRVSAALLEETVPEAADEEARGTIFAAVCGPDAFTDTAVELLKTTLKLADSQIHAFKG